MIDRFKLLYDWGADGVKNQIAEEYLGLNPNLTTEQIDLLYQTQGVDKEYLARYPKLTEEQFMRLFNDKDLNKDNLAQNPNLTTEQIDLLYQTEGVDKDYLARNPKLTEEQFMRLFNEGQNQNADLLFYLTQNPNLTTEQIDLLYQTEGVYKKLLARYPKLTEKQFMRFFKDGSLHNDNLAENPNLTTEQIDLLYYTKGVSVKFGVSWDGQKNLALKPRLTDEQFLRAFNDGRIPLKYNLAQNPSINPLSNQPFASGKQPFASGIFNWRW